MRNAKTMKASFIILPLMSFALAAFAGEKPIDVAALDKDVFSRVKKAYTPPRVIEKYEYYEIRGNSETELRCQMTKNGCRWADGKKYDSLTSWQWRWDLGSDTASRTCTADSVRVTLDVSFRFPKWIASGDAPRPLVDKWDRYMRNLIRHEEGHRDMALEATADFARAVAGLPPVASCEDLDREVRALSRAMMAQLNADENEYDAATDHGSTQGALFP
jgi:predicted secreted Zn-dependent protease